MKGIVNAIASRISGKYLAQIALVCAAQFAAGKVGDALRTVNDGGIGPVWPASGIALAALLLGGYSVWPGIAAGAFLLALLSPLPHWAAVFYAAGTTLAAALGVFLLRWIAKFDNSLSRLRDALGLIVLGAFVSSVVSASIGASILYAHLRSWSGLGSAWLIYWLGDSSGVLLITPVVLTFPNILRLRDRKRIIEFFLLLALLIIGGTIVFGDLPLIPIKLHILTFAVLPFVMWAAIRFGVGQTALSIFLAATIATAETASGRGPFAANTPLMNAVLLDVFFAVVSVTGLILAAAITERERAEQERERLVRERAETEARLRYAAIVESSDDAIASGTLDGIITSWNGGAEKTYGYTEAEAVGKSITMLAPPELPDEEKKILETLRAGDRIEHFETTRLTKTGKRISVSLTISPIKDSSGSVVGISGIARDISNRKRDEEKLREYERAVENAEDMIGVVDREYRFLLANRQYLKMRNMTREQVVGRLIPEILNKEIFETSVKPKLDECFKGNVVRYEAKFPYPIAGERDLSLSYFPVEGPNGIDRAVCILRDITDRKRNEESLRKSEQRFRLAAQAGRMYSFEWDVITDEVVRSSEHANVLAVTEPLRATHQEFIQKIHPEDRPKFVATIAGLTRESPTAEISYRLQSSDGGLVWLRSRGRGFFDGEGKLLRVIGMVGDVTDLKRAEEVLSGMSRKLLESQEQERTRIARELHDDIAQRLALLAVELQRLQQSLPDVPSEQRALMDALFKQTIEISTDVQSMSHRLHSSKLEYLGVVAAMRSFCKELSVQQRVEIDFKSDGVAPRLPPDLSLCLFRVLQEALHNSVKYSGVRHFDVQLRRDDGEIQLDISDSGQGFDIEAAMQTRGLGITSMRERVRLVNGTITIYTKPMSGTKIEVRVPFPSEPDSQRAAG